MTVYTIIGQTLAGKDTLVNSVIENTGVEKVVTTTDRPIREGEVDGIDYNFVDIGELDKDIYFGVRKFFTVYRKDPYCYGMNEDSFDTKKDSIVILDPLGVRELKDKIGAKNIVTVYLNVSEDTLKKRALRRGDSSEEVQRRLDEDRHLFHNANIYCDIILEENDDMAKVMSKIVLGEVGY